MNSKNLHQQFVDLGKERNRISYKLQALLPEIEKQRIWEKQGYQSIYHYAQILAGMSMGVVNRAIRIHKKLEDKPELKKAVQTEGIYKVERIVSIATAENEKDLAKLVKASSKKMLEEYSREVRKKKTPKVELKIRLDEEMEILFYALKKRYGEKLSNKEVLKRILKEASKQGCKDGGETYGNKKVNPTKSMKNHLQHSSPGRKQKLVTRYIPAAQRQKTLQKYQHKCAYPGCNKPHDVLHHRERFANNKSHRSIIPLCHVHHEFAHNGLIQNETHEPKHWRLNPKPKPNAIDELWAIHRR